MENSKHNSPEYNLPFMPEDDNFDFKRYISLFISNWYWFAIALFIALTVAYGINRYSEQVFTVSSTLLIQDDQGNNTNTGLNSIIPGGDIFRRGQNLNNEIGILKSFSLNYRVMQELSEFQTVYVSVGRRGIAESQLYMGCPFIVIPDSIENQPKLYQVKINILSKESFSLEIDGNNDIIRELKFGERFRESGFDFVIRLRDSINYIPGKNELSTRYYFYFESPERLANNYRNKLDITAITEGATLVTLSVSGFVVSQEADYLNKLMELYINSGLELKNATAYSTITFIDKQLGIISDSLTIAENNLERFKLSNKTIDLSSEGSLLKTRIDRLESEKAAIMLQQQYYDYLTGYIESRNESGEIISPSTMGMSDQGLTNLVTSLSQAQIRKKQISFNIQGEIPAIDYADKDIELARNTLSENLKSSAEALKISLGNMGKLISEADIELMKLPVKERLMVNIQRKYDLNNTVYTYLLEKRAEAGIAMASTVSENRIIDKADNYSSSLIQPTPRRNFLLAFLFGFLLPGIGIFFIDYLNNKIIDKKDIEKSTKTPVLGYVSHNDYKTEIPVVSNPGSTLAESFRSIRTALKYYKNGTDTLIISVTSTISSEGKTFTSVNLAAIIAMLGKKVLLVGLDLRKPRIHKVFSIGNGDGMSSFLSGNCDYSSIIKETTIENLYYAPSGPIPPNPAELMETEYMKEFFEKAKKEFDYIIIDTPPIAVVTDALLLAPFVDLNIFIVRQRYTSKNTLSLIDELYKEGKFKNLALIINDISLSGYYGYGLRYGYSMGYGYTYGYNYYGQYSQRYGYSDEGHGYYTEE
jgi:tyrosine-protein kinase Etk/Wzc